MPHSVSPVAQINWGTLPCKRTRMSLTKKQGWWSIESDIKTDIKQVWMAIHSTETTTTRKKSPTDYLKLVANNPTPPTTTTTKEVSLPSIRKMYELWSQSNSSSRHHKYILYRQFNGTPLHNCLGIWWIDWTTDIFILGVVQYEYNTICLRQWVFRLVRCSWMSVTL